ncbi:MAG: MFS transporter, partial [Burkholderiales bacterium]|nr:MFS transporter [Burkholderiales bacterium]
MTNQLPNQLKVLSIASIGALFECYDFMICAFMSNILIKLFFSGNIWLGVFAIFTVAFIARPLGGIFWGHLGDKIGRKKVFSLTMILLVIPTLLIAIFPLNLSKEITISGFIILRFLQGFLVGGEFPGGVTFIAEIVSSKNRATLVSSFLTLLTVGTLLASFVSFILFRIFSVEQVESWAWRLPFLLSIVLVLTAIYIRKKVQETIFFTGLTNRKGIIKVPLFELFSNHLFAIFSGLIIACLAAFGLTTLYVFFPSIIKLNPFISQQTALGLTTIGSLVLIIFMPIWGILADKFSRKTILLISSLLLLVCLRLISVAIIQNSYTMLLIMMVLASVAFAGINTVYCPMLSELFPTSVRFSGVALCYTVAYSICGGLLPLVYLSMPELTKYF